MGGPSHAKKTSGGTTFERPPIVGCAPFYAMRRSQLSDFRVDGIQLMLTLPMAALTDPSAINVAVLRQVLHRPVVATDAEGTVVDDDTTAEPPTVRRVVVDIMSVSPLSETLRQVVGKAVFTVAVVVSVRSALLHAHGVQLGVAIDSPYEETFRVRLLQGPSDDDSSSGRGAQRAAADAAVAADAVDDVEVVETPDAPIALCRCGSDEPVSKGMCVFVGVEPNLLKCLAIRPPRTAAGAWTRSHTDTHKTAMNFEFDAEKQKGNGEAPQSVTAVDGGRHSTKRKRSD